MPISDMLSPCTPSTTINIKKADGQVQEFRQGVFWGQSLPNRSTKYVGSESEQLCTRASSMWGQSLRDCALCSSPQLTKGSSRC